MPDLLASHILPGLTYQDDLISPAEEEALLRRLEQLQLAPFRFHGWVGKRETASFGWRYDFDDGSFEPLEPMPDFLLPLRDKAAHLAGLAAERLVHALIIRYGPGAGIGWHRDRPVFDQVVGVSLGEPATLRLRRRTAPGFDRRSLPLAPRSAYHLTGEARHGWEHSIVQMERTRWSVTFRSLSAKGRGVGAVGDERQSD